MFCTVELFHQGVYQYEEENQKTGWLYPKDSPVVILAKIYEWWNYNF